MFCTKCGANVADGSKFCGICGAPLSAPEQARQFQPDNNINLDVVSEEQNNAGGIVEKKKKKNLIKIFGIAAAALVVVVGVLLGIRLLSSGSGDNAYVYLSNGKYELITDLKSDRTIEIASSRSTNTASSMLAFSPDEKYVYYYTKYDSSNETGTLCRAEFKKLKEDSRKNDKYIEIIATNVKLGFRFFEDGTLTYYNGDYTLFYYDGKTTTQIAKNVNYYYTDDNKRLVYTTGDYDSGYNLYGIVLSDIDNKIKLASNYYTLFNARDFDNILYSKTDDNGNQTLYTVGFDKSAEKLGENAYIVSYQDDAVYYTMKSREISLYDYVTDEKAESDKSITEPDIEDYAIPLYSYYMVYGSDLKESDYSELYTSCTKELYWYGQSTWWCYSMQDALNRNWGDNNEAIQEATQNFINEFGSSANEDGYIPVTEEVKNALQEINNSAGEGNDWQWLWLCYSREPYGNTYDYDAYYADYEVYYEARDRIYLRENLQDTNNNFSVLNLYKFSDGKQTLISENILNTRAFNGAVMYNTVDMVTDKVRLEDIDYLSEVNNLLYLNYENENYFMPFGADAPVKMSAKAAEKYADAYNSGYAYLYSTASSVFMSESNGGLYVASIENGTVGDFEIITDDASVYSLADDTLYYSSGKYSNNDIEYCDLYSYKDGKSTRLAQDIISYGIRIYEDDTVYAYTGYRRYSGYELSMFDSKGEKTFIADEVTQYVRTDKKTVLYISDGDLYSYNGKEKTHIRNDTDYIWCLKYLKPVITLGYDYEYGY